MTEIIKICKMCQLELSSNLFDLNRRCCKKCVTKKNTEKNREYMKEYYKKNSDQIKQNIALAYETKKRKSVIYKIQCKHDDVKEIYVGSTTDINKRIKSHKSVLNNPKSKLYTKKLYEFIKNNGGWNEWEVIIIKEFEDLLPRDELFKIEGLYINQLKPMLNIRQPCFNKLKYEIVELVTN